MLIGKGEGVTFPLQPFLTFPLDQGITPVATHLPGTLNVMADGMTREYACLHKWKSTGHAYICFFASGVIQKQMFFRQFRTSTVIPAAAGAGWTPTLWETDFCFHKQGISCTCFRPYHSSQGSAKKKNQKEKAKLHSGHSVVAPPAVVSRGIYHNFPPSLDFLQLSPYQGFYYSVSKLKLTVLDLVLNFSVEAREVLVNSRKPLMRHLYETKWACFTEIFQGPDQPSELAGLPVEFDFLLSLHEKGFGNSSLAVLSWGYFSFLC